MFVTTTIRNDGDDGDRTDDKYMLLLLIINDMICSIIDIR